MTSQPKSSAHSPASKIAIVTGAGTGVGRAAALALLEDGYSVTLAGRRADVLEETKEMAGEAGSRALVQATDVTDPAQVAAMFKATVDAFGRVDVIFNNAGANAPGILLEDLAVEDWKRVVDVNLSGVFYCIQEAFRVMKAQTPMGGRIINNGSISAHAPRPDSIPYTATKHAVTGLTKTAALDGRKYDIAVSQIDIGNAVSPMTARMADGVKQADGTKKAEPRMPAENVGEAVVFMANLPMETTVQFMTIQATKMAWIGRG
ncbi:MAG: 3-oxoacyl-ACP reductase [Rhodospirillaceae bacterium]|nr:3-oxoacyl-ACP reductase [Rhodospirillaceae bacterium]